MTKNGDFVVGCGVFQAVSTAVGSADGLLYPLTKGLLYLHKPVLLILYKNIIEVWFLRLHDKNLLQTFDLEVTWVRRASIRFLLLS